MNRAFLLLAPIVLLGLSACTHKAASTVKAAEPPPVSAVTMKIDPQPFTATIAITGTLVSRTTVDVKAETIGRVSRFPKEEGDSVKAGEPILWVDEENFQLAVRQAESAVKVAEAALARTRVLETHSRNELERAQNLIKSGGITDKDLKLAAVTEQDSRSQTQLCQAQLDQAKVALDVARKRLRDAVIHSPVTGEIQKKFVNPGTYVEAPTAVFKVVDNARLELEAAVPSTDLGQVRAGQLVTFQVNTFPGETFRGNVVEILPAVDAESRAAKARIHVDNAASKLKAGMFVQGEIRTAATRPALLAPSSALYRDDRSSQDAAVYVVDSGKASRRKVRVGHERDGQVEIIAGLNPGDTIIAEQSVELADGVRIQSREVQRVSQ